MATSHKTICKHVSAACKGIMPPKLLLKRPQQQEKPKDPPKTSKTPHILQKPRPSPLLCFDEILASILNNDNGKAKAHGLIDDENNFVPTKMRDHFAFVVGFLGPQGSGKTTIINSLISFNDVEVSREPTTRAELIFSPDGVLYIDTPPLSPSNPRALQIIAFLMSVCHVIVSVETHEEHRSNWDLVRQVEKLKFEEHDPKEPIYIPHFIHVINKRGEKLGKYQLDKLSKSFKKAFDNSLLRTDQCTVQVPFYSYLDCNLVPLATIIPEIDFEVQEITFEFAKDLGVVPVRFPTMIKALRTAILSIPKYEKCPNNPQLQVMQKWFILPEDIWLKSAALVWDDIRRSVKYVNKRSKKGKKK